MLERGIAAVSVTDMLGCMIIERIQVEEGFLDGLDLSFSQGLNVLIGPRGSGKTSIIELLRYCLGSEAFTQSSEERSQRHALSILGSGVVTVTLDVGSEKITVQRSSEHWDSSGDIEPPIVLSQNEIEAVGLHAKGRLRLIDSISPVSSSVKEREQALLGHIRSQTQERRTTSLELATLKTQLTQLSEQLNEAEALKKTHAEALAKIESAKEDTERLAVLTTAIARRSVRTAFFDRILSNLKEKENRLGLISNAEHDLDDWPSSAGDVDEIVKIRQLVKEAHELSQSALIKIRTAKAAVVELKSENQKGTLPLEEESRTIRRKLEVLQQGAGEVAKKLSIIEQKAGQHSALKGLIKTRSESLKRIQEKRKKLLDELEDIRNERSLSRENTIEKINRELGPRIRVEIERSGINNAYSEAIVNALRGSGLRFNEAAPQIADQMSPREFIEAVENDDFQQIAEITGLSPSRAAKIVERLNEEGVEDILTAELEDDITLSLLDGSDYKTTEELSTGQRCTVVLPLLLMQDSTPLIADQPEDHLDNAFVVETLVKSIRKRKSSGQLIFSTHNANIPVIGEAEKVALLGSDGTRGFVLHAAPLDDPRTVKAITSIMEGGIEAFDRRSSFYHRLDGKQK